MVEDESSDSTDAGLDPEIESLLNSPPDESDDSEDTSLPDIDLEQEPSDQSSEDDETEDNAGGPPEQPVEDIEEATSWVEIMEPAGEAPEMRLQIWGRIWGEIEDVASAFYLLLDPAKQTINTSRLVVFGNSSPLADYHPRMDAEEFEHRLIETGVKDEAVPQVILNLVEEAIQDHFQEEGAYSEIREIIEESNTEGFQEWAHQLGNKIIDRGGFEFQFRAQNISPAQLGEDEQTGRMDDMGPSESSGDSDQETLDDHLRVSVMTSPTSGIPVEELEEGMDVFVRIVDNRAKHLPEELLDPDRSPAASIPLEASVLELNQPDSLPDRIQEGDPEDYLEITVDLEQSVPGRGLVYIEDRIKQETQEETEESPDLEPVPFLLMLAVLLFTVITIIYLF